jgi:hypothetical protein
VPGSDLEVAEQQNPGRVNSLRTFLSEILSRSQLAYRAGFTFGRKRDLYQALGYPRQLFFRDYYERYRRGGLARRIVNIPPKATWARPPDIYEDADPNTETPFERAFTDIANRCGIWSKIERADRLAGIGTFSLLLLGLRDGRSRRASMVRRISSM